MEDYFNTIEQLEQTQTIFKEAIDDLIMAAECMDNYIELAKRPLDSLIDTTTDFKKRYYVSMMNAKFALALNKIDVLAKYLEANRKRKENTNGEENNSI